MCGVGGVRCVVLHGHGVRCGDRCTTCPCSTSTPHT